MKLAKAQTEQKNQENLKNQMFWPQIVCGKQHPYFVLGNNLAFILQAEFRPCPLLSKLVKHISLGLLEAQIC